MIQRYNSIGARSSRRYPETSTPGRDDAARIGHQRALARQLALLGTWLEQQDIDTQQRPKALRDADGVDPRSSPATAALLGDDELIENLIGTVRHVRATSGAVTGAGR